MEALETQLAPAGDRNCSLRTEFGPILRRIAARYFEPVRFAPETLATLRELNERGFVVHVMRTTAWINYLYLAWALVKHALPPIRAVVNLRPWFSKPWAHTAQRGDLEVRFTYARKKQGSGLVFLKQTRLGSATGMNIREDPFGPLVAMARKGDRPVFLVPALFVWEKWAKRLKPHLVDYVFGSPEAPGFLHTLTAFAWNYQRAQFRVGAAIDLKKFIEENPDDSDEVISRKVRGALHLHLAHESRIAFGPPVKPAERVIEETMRDRTLRKNLEEHAAQAARPLAAVTREAYKNLKFIAARRHPTVVATFNEILNFTFSRIYDGIDVDEAGFERAMKVAAKTSIVLCPSHKSHVDYLVLSWVLWNRGYAVPLVAAGANLSFFPLGPYLRRSGAFYLRRTFRGEPIYTACFKAYVKKLVHDGEIQEFFLEGGRSRTGKLLPPKLGLLTWEVDAILEGARNDLYFIPVSINYEKVVESHEYSKELAGGEKKPEDITLLLRAPKVLTAHYGRIHLTFDEPVSVVELARQRGVPLEPTLQGEEKRAFVRALGHRIMYGISKVSTVTPHALVSCALLAHRGRALSAGGLAARVALLRKFAAEEGCPLARVLLGAPDDPVAAGPIRDAVETFAKDELLSTERIRDETLYQAVEAKRPELSFHKNNLMNLVASRSLVASSLFASGGSAPIEEVKKRALFLSRLFKVEFIYRVGATFDTIFSETAEKLVQSGLIERSEDRLQIPSDPGARIELEFVADLLRDFLESYLVAALALGEVAHGTAGDRKEFIQEALETGRREFLMGHIHSREALSKTTLENALAHFMEQRLLVEKDKRLVLGPAAEREADRESFQKELRSFLWRRTAAEAR